MGQRWYVARAKRGLERVAMANLAKQEFAAYFPMQTVERVRRGAFVTESEAVFPGYVLIRFDVEADRWVAINSTRGITSLIGSGETGAPYPIPEGHIEELQERERQGELRVRAARDIRAGDAVRVNSGSLAGKIGSCRWTKRERVMMLLSLLGREVLVAVPKHMLSVVPAR